MSGMCTRGQTLRAPLSSPWSTGASPQQSGENVGKSAPRQEKPASSMMRLLVGVWFPSEETNFQEIL